MERKSPYKAFMKLKILNQILVAILNKISFLRKSNENASSQEHKYSTAHFVRKDAVFTEIKRLKIKINVGEFLNLTPF